MKRLAAQLGITYFSVLAAAFYFSDVVTAVICAVSAVAFAVFMLIHKTRRTIYIPVMALAAFAACLVNLGYSYFFVYPTVERYAGAEHEVSAVLTDEPYHAYKKYYYRLKTTQIDGRDESLELLLKTPKALDIEPDDKLTFVSQLDEVENQYYQSKGYHLVSDSYDTSFEIEPAGSHSLYYYAIQLRMRLREGIDSLLPESEASLCKAIFIGDKYAMSLSDRENFRYAGASYFIVVSGMHFAVLVFLVYNSLRRTGHRIITYSLTIAFIIIFAAVTGFQPSVLRSGLMTFITVTGATIRRQTYPLNHLGLAGVVLPIILSPYGAGDIGLILSFYATLAILLWADPIANKICFKNEYGNILMFSFRAFVSRVERRFDRDHPKSEKSSAVWLMFLKKLWNVFGQMLAVSLAANILVFPISVFVFRGFSSVTLLSALLLNIPIYLILVLSLLVCILYWLGPLRFLAVLLSWPLYLLARYILAVVSFLASLPFAYIRVGSAYVYVWLTVTIILGAVVIALKKRYRLLPYAALLSAIVLLAGWLAHTVISLNTLDLEVYSCGDGMYIGVNDRGRLHLLSMDCRSKPAYEITEELLYRFGGADTAFCKNESALDKYIYYSTGRFAISDYLLYDSKGSAGERVESINAFDSDMMFILDDDLTLSVNVDSGKPLCRLEAGDKTVLIVPKKYKIRNIPEDWLYSDVIVISDEPDSADGLSCSKLIVSSSGEKAPLIADVMADCYESIRYTCDGDIKYDLR